MATIHLDSAGSNTSPYDTWAKAATTWATATGAMAAGDTLVMSSAYAETAASVSTTFPGTAASPNIILSGTKGATSGLTALGAGAAITSSGSGGIVLNGSFYCYGASFISTYAASTTINIGNGAVVETFEDCTFTITGTGNTDICFGAQTGSIQYSDIKLLNCHYKVAAAGQGINCQAGQLRVLGGAFDSGSATPTSVFTMYVANRSGNLYVDGLDISVLGTTTSLLAAAYSGLVAEFANIKVPAGWGGALITGAANQGSESTLTNYGTTGISYAIKRKHFGGTLDHETTIVRTGGATDGTTPISWKVVTDANVGFPAYPLRTQKRAIWNDTTAASVTLTLEIESDSATNLKNNEVALCATYLGTSGSPLSTFKTTAPDAITTASDITASTSTWTTTGQTNPNKQKLALTFTPQVKGPIMYWVEVFKPSATLYVDPMVTVS